MLLRLKLTKIEECKIEIIKTLNVQGFSYLGSKNLTIEVVIIWHIYFILLYIASLNFLYHVIKIILIGEQIKSYQYPKYPKIQKFYFIFVFKNIIFKIIFKKFHLGFLKPIWYNAALGHC